MKHRRRPWLALAAALLALFGVDVRAQDDKPVDVTVYPVESFTPLPSVVNFGPLQWRGGIELASPDPRFGGFSGLALSADGSRLISVSDRGRWLSANLSYSNGQLTGFDSAIMLPILDANGKEIKGKARNDAEALAAWEPNNIDGKLVVGFESYVRIGMFDNPKAPFRALKIPRDIAAAPRNGEIEALTHMVGGPYKDSTVAIAEQNFDAAGDIRAWMIGPKKSFGFTIKRFEDYAITDVAVLPDGNLLTVERSYGTSFLPGMAIRLIHTDEIIDRGAVSPQLLFAGRAPYHRIDNMEGIAVSERQGETRITLMSDDNFNRKLQRTLILQFALLR